MELWKIVEVLERIAPTRHAESWDNVGLLAGDPTHEVARAMLTIDLTAQVLTEAIDQQCELVVSYHPPIFEPLKRIASDSVIARAMGRRIAIYSPHTALDIAAGGTNDVLAELIGLQDIRPLRPSPTTADQCKLVTFVPAEHLEKVSAALFAAGAGEIGDYASCSFQSPGTGTFFGQEGKTSPAVGAAGRLERVAETRLEMIVPLSRVGEALRALRQSHPYEEPAFDLLTLTAPPTGLGMGRVGDLPSPIAADAFIANIKKTTGLAHLLVAGNIGDRPIRRAAVCAGACGKLLDDALAAGADAYVTGELRHHDALRAAEAGMLAVCLLHSNSERPALARLRDRLRSALPEADFILSQLDADPFRID